MDLEPQLKIALKAIMEASQIIMDVYRNDFKVRLKEDLSVVTIADIQSDQKIREILTSAYPSYGILSEETADNKERLNKDFCWIVDPLDGTKDFVNKTNEFSINIALAFKGKIVLGVIAVPYVNTIYYAMEGLGTFKIENNIVKKIHVNDKQKDYTLFVSNFFFKEEEFDKIPNNTLINQTMKCGSSLKACKIAEGMGEICIKFDEHTKEWDTAPSEIIIKEAGGCMSDIYGNENMYNKKDVVNHKGFIIANSRQTLEKFIIK